MLDGLLIPPNLPRDIGRTKQYIPISPDSGLEYLGP